MKKRGKNFVLPFKVKDASPTTTYVQLGKKKRAKRLHGKKLKVTANQLADDQSVDALGNTDKATATAATLVGIRSSDGASRTRTDDLLGAITAL